MLAILGEIRFELLDGPHTMRQSHRWDYAVQQVVEGLPKLQWVADGLRTISIEMLLHRSFTDPSTQLNALLSAASDHSARPLIFGNGDLQGYFVITELSTSYEQLSSDGDVVAIAVRAELAEWELSASEGIAAGSPNITAIAGLAAPPGIDTGTISLPPAAGVGPQIIPNLQGYISPQLPSAGTSLLLQLATAGTSVPSVMLPNDIPVSQIVRAGS